MAKGKAVAGSKIDALIAAFEAQGSKPSAARVSMPSDPRQMAVKGEMSDGRPITAYFDYFKSDKGTIVRTVKLDGIRFQGFQVDTLRKLYDPGTIDLVNTFLAQLEEETEEEPVE